MTKKAKNKNNGGSLLMYVRFPKDIEEALAKIKGELGLKANSDLLEHIVTIFLAERRLISPEWKKG